MDDYLVAMSCEVGFIIQPAGLVAHTPRRILQYFETEYARRVGDGYWVDRLMANVKAYPRVLLPDTRFLKEVEGIRAAGGRVVKIVRIDLPAHGDEYVSEQSIDLIEPDLLIGVKTDDYGIVNGVARHLVSGRWDLAALYDYR